MRNLVIFTSVLLCSALYAIADITQNDIDVLNVALNLECLKAQFYSLAAYGTGLSAELRRNGPRPKGGRKALLSPSALQLAEDIANDEINHVRLLRNRLGWSSVRCPLVDIGPAFRVAANAAFNTTLSPPFDPYESDILFYHAAFILEDFAVTAYTTATANLDDSDAVLASAGVLATEAYHAGAIRNRLTAIADQYVFPFYANVTTIIGAISALRGAIGGGKDGGLQPLVPADKKYSIAFAREISEILSVVYFNTGGKPGGFFPKGLNGKYR